MSNIQEEHVGTETDPFNEMILSADGKLSEVTARLFGGDEKIAIQIYEQVVRTWSSHLEGYKPLQHADPREPSDGYMLQDGTTALGSWVANVLRLSRNGGHNYLDTLVIRLFKKLMWSTNTKAWRGWLSIFVSQDNNWFVWTQTSLSPRDYDVPSELRKFESMADMFTYLHDLGIDKNDQEFVDGIGPEGIPHVSVLIAQALVKLMHDTSKHYGNLKRMFAEDERQAARRLDVIRLQPNHNR